MSILDILSPEFLDDMPLDPQTAFTQIVRRAYNYLARELKDVDGNERSSWHAYEDAQHSVMNVVVASAKRLGISPISDMEIPTRKNFISENFIEFKSEIDHYMTQFLLDGVIRNSRESIPLSNKLRDRIRSHIHALKTLVDDADISETKRGKLHVKIAEFESLLQKDRIPILAVSRVIFEILSVSANVVALSESPTLARLTQNIMQAVAEAKAVEDERRDLPPLDGPVAALPPRRVAVPPPREEFSADLDDEIPF